MKNVLVDDPVHEPGLAKLHAVAGVEVEAIDTGGEAETEIDVDLLRRAHVLFRTALPANHDEARQLELVQIGSVGYSQLYGARLAERGIRACNARGVFDTPIAEWAVAMMVNLARDMRGMIRHQDCGVWDRDARFQREIRGLTLGIWGYGGIGRETARLAGAMGLNVHVLVRSPVQPRVDVYRVPGTGDPDGTLPDRVFTLEEKDAFLAGLDFLVLALPLTNVTEGMIGEHELRTLPARACLLNPARGPIVQEQALLRALREGWIAGAALDTHYHYPMPADHPLWSMPNVIMTPHISGSSKTPSFPARVWDIFTQNVARYVNGEPLINELTESQLRGE